MIAEVRFNLPVDRGFDYLVPEPWQATLRPGMRVVAPFGPRRLVGFVHRLRKTSRFAQLKTLLQVVDETPVLMPDMLRLAAWLAGYYGCSLGQAYACMVPAALRRRPAAQGELVSEEAAGLEPPPPLTAHQQRALAQVETALRTRRHRTFLVHGITGSGKTELYLQAIARALALGRSAIVLVPEIALTPQTIDRFRARFGAGVVLWHSRLTDRQRALQWARLLEGRSRIVVGTRSAVFAPVPQVGVLILDEEHDPSYKQAQTPRYHAREAALARARLQGAVVLLGSATPSVESYYEASRGRFHHLSLPERVRGRTLPAVNIVDMRQESGPRRRLGPFSQRLALELRRIVELKEQAILLLNRRGFARVAQCATCGTTVRCPQCAVPLIYHASTKQLTCHYCNARQPVPDTCRACRKGYLRLRGWGTERIESELHRLFPVSGIARMDTDTTRRRESHRRLYDAIKTQQIDLLVGTQMVAKGLDVPQVTLVGVISADTALNLPDFRAGERTFDLLTQVAGRAGRGDRPGQVIVQTYCPGHYAIRAASQHDYQAFYRDEIRMRRRLSLPPFVHLIELTVQGRPQERVEEAAQGLADALRTSARRLRVTILGPAPHRIVRLRKTTRWCVVLKTRSVLPAVRLIRRVLQEGWRFRGLPVTVDVDPL